ncbi:hypothetical protein [Paenarthrobacter sp. JL.01a]|nr:hypothetical protein [Paenarthrobacter sp. JL.01a]UXM92009.1 hypothetical protein N5P29_01420 [Paenarthrobacter sp. JL.01a]
MDSFMIQAVKITVSPGTAVGLSAPWTNVMHFDWPPMDLHP